MDTTDTLRFALSDCINDAPIGPSRVPLHLLGQFQREVEEFLKGSNKDVDPSQVFVSIEEGSLAIVAGGLLAATGLWADMGHLQNPSALGLLDPKRANVVERWQADARKNPHRNYVLADMDGKLTIRVDTRSDFHNQVEAIWMPVEKFLQGIVMDMGGTTKPNIHLKLADGKTLTIIATQQLIAGEEKNRLYRPALLRVSAEESLKTGELRNPTLLAFDASRPHWDEAEFNKLVQKGTEAWAGVPADWLEELRGRQG
ncbi:MAG: hypothetical protein RSP_03810 [Rhodanobacter sp.]